MIRYDKRLESEGRSTREGVRGKEDNKRGRGRVVRDDERL